MYNNNFSLTPSLNALIVRNLKNSKIHKIKIKNRNKRF